MAPKKVRARGKVTNVVAPLKRGRKKLDEVNHEKPSDSESEKPSESEESIEVMADKALEKKSTSTVLRDRRKLEKVNRIGSEEALKLIKNEGSKLPKRNRKKKDMEDDDDDKSDNDFEPEQKKAKVSKPTKAKTVKKTEEISDVNLLDFANDSKSSDGNSWNLKITSWNVNGVRAWLQKDGLKYLHHEKPDVMCVQETKCSDAKLPAEIKTIDGYHCYWLSGDKEGYSGVGLLSKQEPIDVQYGIGQEEHDNEGRTITAEYEKFYVVTTYTPNAGRGLVRLDYRTEWDIDFRNYVKKLDEKKPVVLCGDLNVAHEEIDLANPKTNKKNAGFTKEERDGFSALLNEGFIDSFRHLYPEEKSAYTFWTYMMNARAKNVGWRLDYFVISKRFLNHLCDSVIRKEVIGSDHCPVTLYLAI